MYKPFRPFGKGTTLLRGHTNHGYYNHLLTGMILQVLTNPSKSNLFVSSKSTLPETNSKFTTENRPARPQKETTIIFQVQTVSFQGG